MKFLFLPLLATLFFTACSSQSATDGAAQSATQQSDTFCLDVDGETFRAKMKETDALVLDIRTADEFNDGHLEGAVNIDFYADDFMDQVNEIDKSKTILLHCQAGGRSSSAKAMMQKAGFTKIYHLEKGYRSLR